MNVESDGATIELMEKESKGPMEGQGLYKNCPLLEK
jgi:hypothetical protein